MTLDDIITRNEKHYNELQSSLKNYLASKVQLVMTITQLLTPEQANLIIPLIADNEISHLNTLTRISSRLAEDYKLLASLLIEKSQN